MSERPVFLEATCGHEFYTDEHPIPPSVVCPEHGLVGLWAQRLEPDTDDPRDLKAVMS